MKVTSSWMEIEYKKMITCDERGDWSMKIVSLAEIA